MWYTKLKTMGKNGVCRSCVCGCVCVFLIAQLYEWWPCYSNGPQSVSFIQIHKIHIRACINVRRCGYLKGAPYKSSNRCTFSTDHTDENETRPREHFVLSRTTAEFGVEFNEKQNAIGNAKQALFREIEKFLTESIREHACVCGYVCV